MRVSWSVVLVFLFRRDFRKFSVIFVDCSFSLEIFGKFYKFRIFTEFSKVSRNRIFVSDIMGSSE